MKKLLFLILLCACGPELPGGTTAETTSVGGTTMAPLPGRCEGDVLAGWEACIEEAKTIRMVLCPDGCTDQNFCLDAVCANNCSVMAKEWYLDNCVSMYPTCADPNDIAVCEIVCYQNDSKCFQNAEELGCTAADQSTCAMESEACFKGIQPPC